MKPTPMTQYRSITTTRVMPPQPIAKPPAYASRLAQHIAMGKTPEQAMRLIERADGHSPSIPVTHREDNGGRGSNRYKYDQPITERVIPFLNNIDWVFISDEITSAIGSSRENIYSALRTLRDQGRVEQNKINVRNKMTWRLV